MKKTRHTITLLAIFLTSVVALHAQDPITLRFTGQDQHGQHVPLSSVNVENLTKRWQEVLYYPDTTLNISGVGIGEFDTDGNGVRLFQNVPNPFDGVTDFALQLPEAADVLLEIYDLNGKVEAAYQGTLDPGTHQFRAWLESPQTYLLNARTENGAVRIKMVNTGRAGQSRIEHLGNGNLIWAENPKNSPKGDITMPFNYGDTMSYMGFAHLANQYFTSSPIVQAQHNSSLIPLTFTLPLPTVITEAATDITTTEAQLNGSVVEHPEYPVTERGFLFAENESLTGAVEYAAGSGSGQFLHALSNLQLATRYYYRAYAQTAMGTTYGDVLFFDTHSELPEIQTLNVTNITSSSASCGGNVTSGGGSSVTARGVCWSTSQSPTVNDNHTDNGIGIGVFTSHLPGLAANTTYYVRAYATNSAGTAYGEQRTFTTLSAFFCGIDEMTDYDGNVYNTVEIGQQCWMKENLRTTHFADGTEIPMGSPSSSATQPFRYAPNGNSGNVPLYGYLYNKAAVMHGESPSNTNPSGVQGVCPSGWHVPSSAEFQTLVNYVGSQSQYVCGGDSSNISKALASATLWRWSGSYTPCTIARDISANNATGFSVLPAGYREFGDFYGINTTASFFTTDNSLWYCMSGEMSMLQNSNWGSCEGCSVRCLLNDSGVDSSTAITPVVITEVLSDIFSSTVSCKGFVTASGGEAVTARGVCWSTSPSPTVNDNHTVDGTGTGRFSSDLAGLSPGTTYHMRTYATNSVGTTYGEEKAFTTYPADSCGGLTVTDYDGNTYHTVPVGLQCWMKENLRTTHFANGTEIAIGVNSSLTVPYRFAPNGHDWEVPTYGYLYNWAALMNGDSSSNTNPSGVQGICPTGWHVPSLTEWEQLRDYLGGQSQYLCGQGQEFGGESTLIAKALASSKEWLWDGNECGPGNDPTTNNATGFSALPAGCSNVSDTFNRHAYYWTTYPNYVIINNDSPIFLLYAETFITLGDGISVRCLRN